MFEIFLILFPLTHGNGRLTYTRFEALVAARAPENLVDTITGFTATRGVLMPSVDRIIFVGPSGDSTMRMASSFYAADRFGYGLGAQLNLAKKLEFFPLMKPMTLLIMLGI